MTYDIRERTSVLTKTNGSKTKFHCPVCNGTNLDIKPTTGEYNCFSGNCDHKDIRAAIDKLEGKEWKPEQDEWKKPVRPQSRKDYYYPDREGNPLVRVQRIDPGDGTKKVFHQYHYKEGQWKKGNPDVVKKLVPIYRYKEVQTAIQAGKSIFWVEGESTADLLWLLGIPATTTIGGSKGYQSYGNYRSDLNGGRIVLTPDRADDGIEYITYVAKDFPTQIEGYYLAGTQGLWRNPQGGMDIGDDIRDLQLTKEQILAKVLTPEIYQQISTSSRTVADKRLEGADKQSALYQQLSALSAELLKQRVGSIVSGSLSGADREAEMVALASELRVPRHSLEAIAQELESLTSASADNVEIEKILSAQRHQLSPHQILPESIANKIEQISKARGVNPEPLILGQLVAVSSVPHANTRLFVNNHGDVLSVFPNLFGMAVGDSGSLKSPTIGTGFTKPLRALQAIYIDEYESKLTEYKSRCKVWEDEDKKTRGDEPLPPRLTVVVAEDATMEKIEDLALHQPKICPAIYRDELIGVFQAFDKHGGKGNDSRAKLLSYYDGSPINIHRVGAGSKISKHDYHPVVFGGIQPEVLKGLAQSIGMDNDGTLCRFLYAPITRTYKAWDENPDTVQIDTNAFNQLIQKVHALPALECHLDSEGQKTWAKFANHYNNECLNNPRLSAWLKHAYSKAIGQLGKLALTLHLIQCATTETLSAVISATTIERAALALDYFISQAIALIATTEDTLEGHLVRILDKAKKLGSIAPRQVQTLFSGKKRIDSATARSYLQQLVDGGYGFLNDKGIFTLEELKPAPSASADNADKVLITYQQPEQTVDKGLNNTADNADNFNQSNPNLNEVNQNIVKYEPPSDNHQIEIDSIGLPSLASTLMMAGYQSQSEAIETINQLCSVWEMSDVTKACEILRECNPVAFQTIDKLLRQYQQRQC